MKIITKLSIGCIALLGMAACTDTDVVSPDNMVKVAENGSEIRIAVNSVADAGTTRADGATSYDYDLLQEEASWPGNQNYFRLHAYMSSDLTKEYIDDYVMYNTYVSVFPWRICTSGGDAKTYYWPGTTAFDFFAYAPAMEGGVVKEPNFADHGLTYDGFDAAENKHTLTCNLNGYRTGDQSLLKEFIYAYETNQTQAEQGLSGVTLHFQHPLAAIFLKISAAFQQLQLQDLTFTSETTPGGEGIFFDGNGTCSTNGTTWVKKETAVPHPFVIDINKIMGESMFIGNIFDNPFLVMPQQLTDRTGLEDIKAVIRYRKQGSIEYKSVTLSITDDIKQWEAGKAYYYSLDLGKDESITVSCTVEPWVEYGSYTVQDVDRDDPEPYDP